MASGQIVLGFNEMTRHEMKSSKINLFAYVGCVQYELFGYPYDQSSNLWPEMMKSQNKTGIARITMFSNRDQEERVSQKFCRLIYHWALTTFISSCWNSDQKWRILEKLINMIYLKRTNNFYFLLVSQSPFEILTLKYNFSVWQANLNKNNQSINKNLFHWKTFKINFKSYIGFVILFWCFCRLCVCYTLRFGSIVIWCFIVFIN